MKLLFFALTSLSLHAAALTPEQERASFHLADEGLTVELVAAEPDVFSPVAIAWDANGRMFVAEMMDYPLGPGFGQIRMLQDLDGDGVYEKSIVFADKLHFPNGVMPWRNGLLVTSAPNILFLRDTDGDGRADERRVILTGFGEGNQQLRVNGLYLGLDGWIYGANGRSDGELRRPGDDHGVSLRGHDFRFKPDTGEFEAIAGRSQFGVGHDDWGNRFLSWNTIAIRHEVIPERLLARNPNIPLTEAVHDLAPEGDTGEVFPLTPTPQTFNNESTSHFNALAGLTIYRGDALPAQYYGNAFMGETLRNLVHHRVLEPHGPTFIARRVEQGKEFLASTDPWFHPVNFATGPDGALYIADFYRQWVEHPGYVPEHLRDKYAWRTGAEHGRIWRVRPRDWKRPPPFAEDFAAVSLLNDPNGWRRDTAFRSLLESQDEQKIADLRHLAEGQTAANGREPYGTVLALNLLSNFGRLGEMNVSSVTKSENAHMREAASRLGISSSLDDPSASVRLWTILSATNISTESLARVACREDLDHFIGLAIRASATQRASSKLQDPRAGFHNIAQWRAGVLVDEIRKLNPQPRESLLELVEGLGEDAVGASITIQPGNEALVSAGRARFRASTKPSLINLAYFAGFAHVSGRTNSMFASDFLEFIPLARQTATDPATSETAKRCALRVLAELSHMEKSPAILNLLLPTTPEPLQRAAAEALAESRQPFVFATALKSWDRYEIATRRQLLASASIYNLGALVDALEAGTVLPEEIDPVLRQRLLRTFLGATKDKVEKVLGTPPPSNRAAVIEKFTPALQLSGDKSHGRQLFEKTCAQCHTFAGFGGKVGPSLSGINARPKEALLVDILDPSRQVSPEFLSYTVETNDGESIAGLLISETPGSITIRRPNIQDETIPRSRVKSVQAGKLSLMPDGLDAGMTPQDMADLLQFLADPP